MLCFIISMLSKMFKHCKIFPFAIFFIFFTLLFEITNGTSPTGCSYDSAYSSTGVYTCVFGSYSEPLTYSAFSSPLPQRLKITNLNGNLPASGSAFSGFSSFTSGSFDRNYQAYLELVCTTSGSITLTTSTFTDMSYLQEVKFSFCNIVSLSNGILGPFGSLNSLIFEHGSIASYSTDFLTSVTIESLAVAEPKGELIIKDCSITPTTIPAGVFDGQTSIRTIQLVKAGITAIDASAFSLTTQLNYMSLVDNSITSLESNLFTSMKSLSSIDLGGLAYDCSCSNLDVLTYSSENSVKLPSDLICNTPASYQDKKATKFYAETCATVSSCSGLSCYTAIEIVGFVLLGLALIVACVALAMICHAKRQITSAAITSRRRRPNRWSKMKNAMRATNRGRRGEKPPMKSKY